MGIIFQPNYSRNLENLDTITLSGPGTYACLVVSEASVQGFLKAMCGPPTEDEGSACIIPAICHSGYIITSAYALGIQIQIQGKIVGYLNKKDARKLGKWLGERGQSSAICSALIRGGITHVKGHGQARYLEHDPYRVWLDLP